MGLIRNTKRKRALNRAEKRAKRMSHDALLMWSQRMVGDLGQHLSDYTRETREADLHYSLIAIEAINALVDELLVRHTDHVRSLV